MTPVQKPAAVEMWAGVECTVNRVCDRYFNQLEWNGHTTRLDDLDRFAALGITALRFPVLWELCHEENWRWPDAALARLRELGIRLILDLLHHGSGPPHTNLLDPEFPKKFAEYAAKVARRYPWVSSFTPINEPMTTARFSGLYGVWYPHGRSHGEFLRALTAQCRGISLAMEAIRRSSPDAVLIQTEDFGRTYSTIRLAPLARDLNERRWLTLDLLRGTLRRGGAMWGYLVRHGISEAELGWFADHPCSPDVIGVNHYLTSDRFLDDQIDLYPPDQRASAGPYRFVDIEAVRRCHDCDVSAKGVLRDAWQRYAIPVAVTEAHLGCTREEQMRWLAEVVTDARALAAEGVDVRAVTAWSLLGAFNWNVLVTRDAGYYEPGVFDLRAPAPRPTAIARLVRTLAAGGEPDHPVLESSGWWRRPERILHGPAHGRTYCEEEEQERVESTSPRTRPLLIVDIPTGLDRVMAHVCGIRGIEHRVVSAGDDFAKDVAGWAVCTFAGKSSAAIAKFCREQNLPLLAFSSDEVFDGAAMRPYLESDRPSPSSDLGRDQLRAEIAMGRNLRSLIVRSGPIFGYPEDFLHRLRSGEGWTNLAHRIGSPVYAFDLFNAALDLLIDDERGIWHLVHGEPVRLAEWARETVPDGIPSKLSSSTDVEYYGLASERGWIMPDLENALHRYREGFPELTEFIRV